MTSFSICPISESLSSTTTGTLKNNASQQSGYIRLIEALNNQDGQLEWNVNALQPFQVTFDFWIGGGDGINGADAVYFYFGCSSTPRNEDGNNGGGGYIIAFDEYLLENNPYFILFDQTKLASIAGAAAFVDSAWHTVKITIENGLLSISLDNVAVLSYQDTGRVLPGNLFGFGARCGGSNNEHRIRNVSYCIPTHSVLPSTYLNVCPINESLNTNTSGTIKDNAVQKSGYVQLTQALASQFGEVEWTRIAPAIFQMVFDFWAGGGSGADGIYFYFGNWSTPHGEDERHGGYIIAFDEYTGDLSAIQIKYNGDVIYLDKTIASSLIGNSAWHTAKIIVNNTNIKVFLDNAIVIDFDDIAHRTVAPSFHIFYYMWWGNPTFNGGYRHWNNVGHTPPNDIDSNYYPVEGPYSSYDPQVITQHMQWIKQAGVDVVILSWWGQGSYEDLATLAIMNAAATQGLKVAFLIEPYGGRTPSSTVTDIAYIYATYGNHAAFYRVSKSNKWGPSSSQRGVFYVYDAYTVSGWAVALDGIRGTNNDAIILSNNTPVMDTGIVDIGHFDGFFTYNIPQIDGSGFAATGKSLSDANSLFVPCAGPGYLDARNGGTGNTTRDNGDTYDRFFNFALNAQPTFVGITSFNEFHEGSQIEPVVKKGAPYSDYEGAYGSNGVPAQTAYITRTKFWKDQLFNLFGFGARTGGATNQHRIRNISYCVNTDIYTRQASSTLSTDDTYLTVGYLDSEVEKTKRISNQIPDTEDDIGQAAILQYMVHQFKTFIGAQSSCNVEFLGESDLAPSLSTVYLQIYNHITNLWETIDSNSTFGEDITFELKARIPDTTKYKNSQQIISCRVYQLAI